MRTDSGARLEEGHLVSGEGRVGLERWRVNSYTWQWGWVCGGGANELGITKGGPCSWGARIRPSSVHRSGTETQARPGPNSRSGRERPGMKFAGT